MCMENGEGGKQEPHVRNRVALRREMGIVQRRSIEIKQVLRDLQTVDTWKCCILHGKLRQTPTDQLQAIPIATQPAAEVSAHTVAGSEPRGVTRYAPIERDLPQELVGER